MGACSKPSPAHAPRVPEGARGVATAPEEALARQWVAGGAEAWDVPTERADGDEPARKRQRTSSRERAWLQAQQQALANALGGVLQWTRQDLVACCTAAG